MNPDGMVSLLNYHEDGVTPSYMILRIAYSGKMLTNLAVTLEPSPVVITDQLLFFIHKNTGTDVILNSSFILMLICLKWRHYF